MKIFIGKEQLVYSVPVNPATKKWGVYAIPRLWRDVTGKLIIRFNGEIDCGDTDNMQAAPNLYFVSEDNGKSWSPDVNGENKYPPDILNGIASPYVKTGDSLIAFRERKNLDKIENTVSQKEFMAPNGEAIVNSYRYGDISEKAKGMERLRYQSGKLTDVTPVTIDFPEREILVNKKGNNGHEFVDVEERVKQCIFKNNYFSSVIMLDDETLLAVSCGQHPDVNDHYSGVAYLVESNDMGLTWKKRSTIAMDAELPYGYTGDGHETTLTLTKSGVLMCAMRMDMSINPNIEKPICDTMIAVSKDNGFTWKKPFSVSDSSVTPQLVSFENGVTAIVYGRPGVHFKYTLDDGKTWSNSLSIIGKTLKEYRNDGVSDMDSKYSDTCSYSNVFVEKISEDTMLVLYTNMKYDEGDGVKHKSAFVRTVRFVNE